MMKTRTFCGKSLTVMFLLSFLVGCSSQVVNYSKGDYSSVVEEHEGEEHSAGYDDYDATGHSNVCISYFGIKQYDKFDECYNAFQRYLDQPQTFKQKFLKRPKNNTLVDNLTTYYVESLLERGLYQKALTLSEEKLEQMESGNANRYFLPDFNALAGLAHALLGNDDRAKGFVEKIGGHAWFDMHGFKKNQKIKIYIAMGDYHAAKELLDGADYTKVTDGVILGVTVALSVVNPVGLLALGVELSTMLDQIAAARRQFLVAKVHYETGDFTKAQQEYDPLLEKPFFKNMGSMYYVSLHDTGRMLLRQGQTDVAIARFKEAIDIIELQRSSINTEVSKIGFVGDKQKIYFSLIEVLFDQGRYDEAFSYVERGKARALVDMLAGKQSFGAAASSKKSQNDVLLSELRKSDERIAIAAYRPGNTAEQLDGNSIDNPKTSSVRGLATPQKNLNKFDKELVSLVSVDTLKVAELQALLAKDETLIEYYGFNEDLLAFVVTDTDVRGVRLRGDTIQDDIESFRNFISTPPGLVRGGKRKSTSLNSSDTSERLYTTLIKPLLQDIKTKKLTIVAHGALHYLPFNALHDGKEFMIDTYSIRMLPSASVMAFLGSSKVSDRSMLILSNPDLGNPQYDLPAAEQEGIAIGKNNSKATLLSRQAATETAMRQQGGSRSILHIASHGEFDSDNPLDSRLLLVADGENDGNLTVGELYDLELNNDLVTLSACETGLGKIKNGDDVIGLTRGFFFAGANSIVSSLWMVDDTATSRLMVHFYQGLDRNSKMEALRLAQLDVKKNYNEHPFFWAAFQLNGAVQ